MPKTFRQWIFAKPLEKDAIQAEQFALREMPIPELRPDQALLSYGAAAALYAERIELPAQAGSLRRAFGISETVEAVLRARNIKSEAWIVDAFYHQRLEA